jgi:hypothetical protein
MSDPQQFPSTSADPATAPSYASSAQPPYSSAPAAGTPSGYSGQPAADAQIGYPAAPRPRGSDGVARMAFILAIVSVALAVLNSIFVRFVVVRLAYTLNLGGGFLGGLNVASQIVLFLAYGTTLVFGLLGARSDRKLFAGIAIGVGGAGVILLLIAFLSGLITSLL